VVETILKEQHIIKLSDFLSLKNALFLFNYRSSDVDMELKKGFFLNIQGHGQLMMLKNEDILAWITRTDYSISCLL
jgi:hypothetical protein